MAGKSIGGMVDPDVAADAKAGARVIRSKAPVGNGTRFKSLVKQLSSQDKVQDAPALAAAIGRKKFGASRFAKMAK